MSHSWHRSSRLEAIGEENGFISAPCSVSVEIAYPLPDARCSPDAINPTITPAVLKDPEFRTGCIRDCTRTSSQKATPMVRLESPHSLGDYPRVNGSFNGIHVRKITPQLAHLARIDPGSRCVYCLPFRKSNVLEGGHMKKLLLLTLLLLPTSAFADSFALATATSDFCGCAWTTTGTAGANPIPRSFSTSGISPDGVLRATADAHGIDGGDTVYRHSSAFIDDAFFVFGTGSLTFTLSYTLTTSCVDAPYGGSSSAVSMVSLSLFGNPNEPPLSTQIESLDCRDGESRSGVLTVTVSRQFADPIVGAVFISVRENADSIAAVPEAPSLGLIAIGVLRRRRSQRVA